MSGMGQIYGAHWRGKMPVHIEGVKPSKNNGLAGGEQLGVVCGVYTGSCAIMLISQ